MSSKLVICDEDLSNEDKELIINKKQFITIDTETTGLDPIKDRLCLIQIYDGDMTYILKYNDRIKYNNLINILENKHIKKVFHHANFDLRFLLKNLGIEEINNVACTKISSKLLNGLDESSSLKYLVKKYLDIDIDKKLQTSDWREENLSEEQIVYAQNDVIYLFKLWIVIKGLLIENKKDLLAQKCFDYLPINSKLHNEGIENIFIY